jgi:hypothetical protein
MQFTTASGKKVMSNTFQQDFNKLKQRPVIVEVLRPLN